MTQQLLQRLSYRGILAGDGVSARIAHANLAIRPMAPSVSLQGSRCIWRRVLSCFIERQLYVHYSPTSKTRYIQAIFYPYIINIYMYIYINLYPSVRISVAVHRQEDCLSPFNGWPAVTISSFRQYPSDNSAAIFEPLAKLIQWPTGSVGPHKRRKRVDH